MPNLEDVYAPGDDGVRPRRGVAVEILKTLTNEGKPSGEELENTLSACQYETLCLRAKDEAEKISDAALASKETRQFEVALGVDQMINLIRALAGLEIPAFDAGTYWEIFELQLRTILCGLFVLRSQNVQQLQHRIYENLRERLRSRFTDLQWLPIRGGEMDLPGFSKTKCLYLFSVILQYLKNFQPARPYPATGLFSGIRPVAFGLMLAHPVFGNGGFDISAALHELKKRLKEVAVSNIDDFRMLFTLQELTYHALALRNYTDGVNETDREGLAPIAQECSSQIEAAILETAERILREVRETRTPTRSPADFDTATSAVFSQDPPSLDLYHYIYGVMDCVVQMSHTFSFSDPTEMHKFRQFEVQMRHFAIWHEETTLSWKAHEFFEIIGMRRFSTSTGSDSFGLCGYQPGEPPCHHLSGNASSSSVLPAFKPILNAVAWSEGEGKKPALLESTSKLNKIDVNGCLLSGLSPDCEAAFFIVGPGVKLFQTGVAGGKPKLIVNVDGGAGEVLHAAIADGILVVLWESELSITNFTTNVLKTVRHTFEPAEGAASWLPVCLDVYHWSKERFTTVAIAGQLRWEGSANGNVVMFDTNWNTEDGIIQRSKWKNPLDGGYLAGDVAKSLTFGSNGDRICCVTQLNQILVWTVDEQGSLAGEPFKIQQHYTKEPRVLGITSANVFVSRSANPYVFWTTWPSSERETAKGMFGGEWSYLCPVSTVPATIPFQLVHPLKLTTKRLVAGAVAPEGNMVAARDKSGEIALFTVGPGEFGGLQGTKKYILKYDLKPNDHVTASSMRFKKSHSGLDFYAVDHKGNMIYQPIFIQKGSSGKG